MSKQQQLLELISSIEDAELKSKLETTANGAFTDITNIKNDAIESRDATKEKLRKSNSLLDEIKTGLKLEDDFSVMDIKEKIKNNSNADEIEARFKTDLDTVRNELNQAIQDKTDITAKFEDTMFTNSINGSGELNNFVDDAMARNMILNEYRSKTILEDGKLYKKDEITGKIATDAISGDKLGIDAVTKDILGTVSDIYKKPEIVAQGGGSKPTTTQTSGALKRSEMSASEKGKYISENGQDAYLNLSN